MGVAGDLGGRRFFGWRLGFGQADNATGVVVGGDGLTDAQIDARFGI